MQPASSSFLQRVPPAWGCDHLDKFQTGKKGRSWWRLWGKAVRDAEGSSASMTKLSIAYASKKLKCNPALLKWLGFDRLCILDAVTLLWRTGLIGSGCAMCGLGLGFVLQLVREMLYGL